MGLISEEKPITPLVRQYSLEKEKKGQTDSLTTALIGVVKKEDQAVIKTEQAAADWKKWLQFAEPPADHVLSRLEYQRKQVVDMWKEISHIFPSNDGTGFSPDRIPTIEDLHGAITKAQTAWHEKRLKGMGKAKDRFFSFLETMNDHSYLFSVVPQGDRYLSLITGVVTTVVNASVNHKRIADGFSLALVDISSDLRFVHKTTRIADSSEMKLLVVELYVGVFKLLCHAMSWFRSSRKRFLAALNKNFYDSTVQELVHSIQKSVQRIRDEADYIAHNRVERIQDMLSNAISLRPMGTENRGDDLDAIRQKLESMEEKLGYASARTLRSVEDGMSHRRLADIHSQRKHRVQPVHLPPGWSEGTTDEETDDTEVILTPDDISESDGLCTRHEIEQLTHNLAKYLEDGRELVHRANALQGTVASSLPAEVLFELRRWIRAPESRMAWIAGGPVLEYGTGLSAAALRLCSISKDAGLPCVSFVCKMSYRFASTTQLSTREAGLVAMLYSIIVQLAYLLPTEFPASDELEECKGKFRSLDGTMDSVEAALDIVRALLVHAPPSLIWVLDGFQLVEGPTTRGYLAALVDILRDQEQQGGLLSKVCFTTDGNSSVLMRALSASETIDASRMEDRIPGRPMRAAADMSELGWW